MLEARRLAGPPTWAPEGTAVRADCQTAGRGRHGRRWETPPGSGVALTLILRPQVAASRLPELGLVTAAAVHAAVAARLPAAAPLQLKWPNDLLCGARKLAGILLEAELDAATGAALLLVGIGINVRSRQQLPGLPAEVAARHIGCADLGDIVAPTAYAAALAADVVDAMQREVAAWQQDGLQPALRRWRDHDALAGREVRVDAAGGPLEGRACGLAADGRLLVQTADGQVAVRAGEVTRVGQGAACSA